MTLKKAIKILAKLEKALAPTMPASGTSALKLGVEALIRLQLQREDYSFVHFEPLPSETGD